MRIELSDSIKGDAAAVPIFADGTLSKTAKLIDKQLDGQIARVISQEKFSGKPGQGLLMLTPETEEVLRILLIGMGEKNEVNELGLQRFAALAVQQVLTGQTESLCLAFDPSDLAGVDAGDLTSNLGLGAELGAYRFDHYRTRLPKEKRPSLSKVYLHLSESKTDSDFSWAEQPFAHIGEGTKLARDLVNEPPNIIHPESYADKVSELEKFGLEIQILGEEEMQALGMNALLGVGLGSEKESKLAIMRWRGRKGSDWDAAFVGKGVCFDTGGISLKPGAQMDEMKGDMGGSAAVVGAMRAIAGRKAKANILGIVGLVENMPDGKAQRPGDIVTSADGQTIEILNTDAEGRLVLADALWYAQEKEGAKLIIDLATLTGACVIALGQENAGLYANRDNLAEQLGQAGKDSGELVWRLPLAPNYDKLIDSKVADMKNIGGRYAGSITAAQFLQRFIHDDVAWAHLDIAGTAWKDKSNDVLEPVWGTGFGVRLLDRFVAAQFES